MSHFPQMSIFNDAIEFEGVLLPRIRILDGFNGPNHSAPYRMITRFSDYLHGQFVEVFLRLRNLE